MNLKRICDAATAAALRANWLINELEPLTEYGRKQFEAWDPFAPGDENAASQHAKRIAAIGRRTTPEQLEAVREALRALPDVGGSIARARLGEALTDPEFLLMLRFCENGERLAALVDPAIFGAGMTVCAKVREALAPGKTGDAAFYLSDKFSDRLAEARKVLEAAEGRYLQLRIALSERVAEVLHHRSITTEEFIVMRDELKGALPSGVRVIREAPSYLLCELELDDKALQALEARDRAFDMVAEAEEEVRTHLSALIGDNVDALEASAENAGRLDMMAAAARFAQRHDCIAPQYVSSPSVRFTNGRFSPLEHELAMHGQHYFPIDLALERSNVLTGPNMGGKSASLRTAGFVALCGAFGLPVPADSASVGLFERISWLGVGAENDDMDEQLLSSFAREVVRLREILIQDHRTLWLIDEFARTTGPHEAQALLLALLHTLRQRDGCAFAATHLMILDDEIDAARFAVRGLRSNGPTPQFSGTDDALKALAERMDYRIQRVSATPSKASDAIELAAWLGLDQDLVESAKEILARCSR